MENPDLTGLFAKFTVVSIGLEERSKSCLFVSCTLQNSGRILLSGWIENNHMLSGQMNLKANNVGDLVSHIEMERAPAGLAWSYVAAFEETIDLVFTFT